MEVTIHPHGPITPEGYRYCPLTLENYIGSLTLAEYWEWAGPYMWLYMKDKMEQYLRDHPDCKHVGWHSPQYGWFAGIHRGDD